MGKEAARNIMKNELLDAMRDYLTEHLESDVLRVGTSELAIPGVDDNGEEFFYKVAITIPRGERNGEGGYTPWDAYAEAGAYKDSVAAKALERKIAAENKERQKKEKERKKRIRESKKILKGE